MRLVKAAKMSSHAKFYSLCTGYNLYFDTGSGLVGMEKIDSKFATTKLRKPATVKFVR